MAMQSSGQIKWSEIQTTHGGTNPISISEYYGKYYTSAGARRATSGMQKASYLFSTSPSVNGGWGSFSSWSACSAACDGGTQTRSRSCDNPSASYGGNELSCSGSASESQSCNTDSCSPDSFDTNGTYSWTAPTSGTVDVYIRGAGWSPGGSGCKSHGCSSCSASHWNLSGATTSAFGSSVGGSNIDNTQCGNQYAYVYGNAGSSTYTASVTSGTSYTIVVSGGFMFQTTYHGQVDVTYQ